MITVRFDEQALADIDEIRGYISSFDHEAAGRVVNHIVARIEALKNKPDLGKPSSRPGLRVLYPIKYPYRVYYLYLADEIVILHIRHTSRDVPDLDQLR